jgi:hypothetical protein
MLTLAFHLPPRLSEQTKREYYFYPDILFYDLDKDQYVSEWSNLRQNQGGYLMVKEGKLYRVNIFQFLFQTIKGWLGFEDACHPDKIKMAAMKFCYFGYLNGYPQDTAIQSIKSWEIRYQPAHSFLSLCKSARNNANSHLLQKTMLNFYQEHTQNFNLDQPKTSFATSVNHPACVHYKFGQRYADHKEWNEFAALDPQNMDLITASLFYFPQKQETLPQSTCRRMFAISQLNTMQTSLSVLAQNQNAHLKKWHLRTCELLELCPELKIDYIDFMLQLKSTLAEVDATERNSLRQDIHTIISTSFSPTGMILHINDLLLNKKYRLAFSFIEILATSKIDNAVKFIEKNHNHLYGFLQAGSALSQAYAKALVKTSNGYTTLFGFVGAGQYLKQAVALDPNLAHQDCAAYCFKKFIKASKWDEAFQLLQQRRTAGLSDAELTIDDRRALADYYTQQGNTIYTKARATRAQDFQITEEKYHDSLAMMACAAEVLNEDNYIYNLNVHRRLCAQIILDADQRRGSCTSERIELALGYIDAITAAPSKQIDPHFIETHIRLLEEKTHQLHQLCLNPDALASGSSAEPEHKAQCQQELSQLMTKLDLLITLWQKMPKSKSNARLAAVYFLKAECINYFELSGNAGEHYAQACRYAPNEPYYGLRYAEFYSDTDQQRYKEESSRALQLLPSHGKTASDYMHWFDERWLAKPERISPRLVMAS